MDRNTTVGFLLIGVIFVFFYMYNQDGLKEFEAQQQRIADSIEAVDKQARAAAEEAATPAEEPTTPDTLISDSGTVVIADKYADEFGVFSQAAAGSDKTVTLENDLIKVDLQARGGRVQQVVVKDYWTHDSSGLITLIDGDKTLFEYQFAAKGRVINTERLFFETRVEGNTAFLTAYTNDRKGYIEQSYTVEPGSYMVNYNLRLVGLQNVLQSNRNDITLLWQSELASKERSIKLERGNSTIYFKHKGDEVDWLTARSDEDEEKITTPLRWISFKEHFFNSTLIADGAFNYGNVSFSAPEEENDTVKMMHAEMSIPYQRGPDASFPMRWYFGPNHFNTLKSYDIGLESLIDLGWPIVRHINKYFIIWVFNALDGTIANYGIIILIMTLLIKLIIFPLTYKTYMSGAKMKLIKPEIDKLKEKYGGDQQKMGMEQMKLFRKAGVNPLGGCIPMLLQMPILVAMFYFFPSSIELRQQGFLWATDLSSYDSVMQLPFTIPFYGSHVSLFTLLMAVTTIFYTKMNSQMTGAGAGMAQMKVMMYVMPIFMIFIFNSFSAALTYYYFLQNIISFGQQFIVKRFFINDEEVLRKMKEKQAKPSKKSKFQERLDKMQKQQKELQKKRKKRK